MNKRTKFLPLVILGAILMSLIVIAPVFSADAGDILIVSKNLTDADDATDDDDALQWVRQGSDDGPSTIQIEVVDEDLNVPEPFNQTFDVPVGYSGLYFSGRVDNAPFAAASLVGSGISVPYSTSATSTVSPFSIVSQVDGTFQVLINPPDPSGFSFNLSYKGAASNNTEDLVTVSSNDYDLVVKLEETGVDTGVFRGMVDLVPQETEVTNLDGNDLRVGRNNDEVTAEYEDADPEDTVEYSVRVESVSPIVSSHSPANGTIAESTRPDFEAEVTDSDSGMDEDGAGITLVIAKEVGGNITDVHIDKSPRTDEIDGGQAARESVPSGSFSSVGSTDVTYHWWYVGTDLAGNVGVSDQAPTDDDGEQDECRPYEFNGLLEARNAEAVMETALNMQTDKGSYALCQGFSYQVDVNDPELVSARTGAFWDNDIEDDDKTNMDPNDADLSSILLIFDEDLDPSTVAASDFMVDGNDPLDAEVFAGNMSHVFLTVPQLDSDEEPEIRIVDYVSDIAGRRTRTGTIDEGDSTDGIAPTLEVSISGTASSGDRPVTDKTVTITLSVNEKVSQPSFRYWRVTDVSNGESGYVKSGGTNGVIPFKQGNTYEVEFNLSDQGLYSILVSAGDSNNSNTTATVGVDHRPSVTDNTLTTDVDETHVREPFEDVSDDALLIEVDTDVAGGADGLVLDPASVAGNSDRNTFSSDDPNLFITIDLSAEGSEYPAANMDKESVVGVEDVDTYGAITIVSATLDDADISSMLAVDGNGNKFLYKASALSLGDHEVVVEVTDAAGNEREFTGTVTITERDAFSLALNPGWNLVSIPGQPADSAVNSVVPADHPASTILSYDPSIPGGWLTAVRDGAGNFTGTLTDITAGRAYWIETDAFEAIEIDIPRLASGAASLPPTVNIVEGWNLVPVVDVDEDGEDISAATYFSGVDVSRIYTFDTIKGTWNIIDPETEDLEIGRGYWVYATEAGTLAP